MVLNNCRKPRWVNWPDNQYSYFFPKNVSFLTFSLIFCFSVYPRRIKSLLPEGNTATALQAGNSDNQAGEPAEWNSGGCMPACPWAARLLLPRATDQGQPKGARRGWICVFRSCRISTPSGMGMTRKRADLFPGNKTPAKKVALC